MVNAKYDIERLEKIKETIDLIVCEISTTFPDKDDLEDEEFRHILDCLRDVWNAREHLQKARKMGVEK